MSAYDRDRLALNYPPGVDHHYWNLARNATVRRAVQGVVGPGSAVLEIGCGRGVVLRHLRAQGVDCRGVEPAPSEIDAALAPYVWSGIEAGELPEADRRRFDVLLLLDVIEHIADPFAFLTRLGDDFPRAEWLIVAVPARQELWTNYDDFFGHFRRYDRGLLEEQTRSSGWVTTRCFYFFRLLYVPIWTLARLGVERSLAMRPPRRAVSRLAHRAFAMVCLLDQVLLPSAFPGTSILGVFRRRAPGAGSPAGHDRR